MEIVNIVAVATFNKPIDLGELSKKLKDSEFASSGAKWLKWRLPPEQYYIAFYKSGKFLITGVKSEKDIENVAARVVDLLHEKGLTVKINTIKVQNMVILDFMKTTASLEKITKGLIGEDISYEPDQFPGLVYKNDEGVTFLLFHSGKIIMTGIKTSGTAKSHLEKFKRKINAITKGVVKHAR